MNGPCACVDVSLAELRSDANVRSYNDWLDIRLDFSLEFRGRNDSSTYKGGGAPG